MKPQLSPAQGRVIRALASYLSNGGKDSMTDAIAVGDLVVEAVASRPWSSLTLAGTRHRLIVRLSGALRGEKPIDGDHLVVPGCLVAVERAAWTRGTDGVRLTLDLLVLAAAGDAEPPSSAVRS